MIGSCLFSKPRGRAEQLGGGGEIYFGHFQSLHLGWKPFLNVDAVQGAFMQSGKVHLIFADELKLRRSGADLPANFFDCLTHRKYRFPVKEFGKKITNLKVKI